VYTDFDLFFKFTKFIKTKKMETSQVKAIQVENTSSIYNNYNRDPSLDQMAIFNRLPLSDEQKTRILAHLLSAAPLAPAPSIQIEVDHSAGEEDECKSPSKKRRRS
jgi:hypothetical protein